MQDGTIGRRYARALAHSLEEEGGTEALSKVEEQLSAVAALLEKSTGHPEFRQAMLNPSFSAKDRKAILEKLAERYELHPIAHRALLLLVEKDRIPHLPSIARAFREEVDRKVGRVRALITSAAPLADNELKDVVKALEKKTGMKVVPEVKVDPEVISGVSAKIGGQVFDNTVRAQLDRLRAQLGVV